MARSKRDLTTKTSRFGPWRPMRGAQGEALERLKRIPRPTSPTEYSLDPGRNNLLKQGASKETYRRGGRWRA